ncbi:MAG: gliding motility lipoprotein GldH [Bacteroidia bacterium]|nr:gliding motility lipoprotein GldH [Bacteroidia bacterium]
MTIKTGRSNFILSVIMLFAISSCNSNVIYTDEAVMPDMTWNLFSNTDFSFPVTNTTESTDLYFTIRTGSQYPFRNIFLFVTTSAPDGKSITDTLEYEIADEKGNWLGKGFGDIHELKLPYRKNVFFPVKGTYHFKIQHGMRTGDLKGVYDIGLRVEKYVQ